MRRSLRLALLSSLLLAGMLGDVSSTASAARPLTLGFVDDFSPAGDGAVRLVEAQALGSGVARILVRWSQVAPPVRPAGFPATDPGAPQYNWTATDATVRDAEARGLRVILSIISAPRWAEGARRPPGAAAGTWRPSADALGDFATAIARRYSGRYLDPGRTGAALPSVRYWQVWNEPNLSDHLSPQWVRRGRGFRLESPRVYRAMLNAAYAGVKSVRRDNLVVSAGTAPYGDPAPGGDRVMPVRFWRSLLCVAGKRLKAVRCPSPARFDVLAHHPYGIRGPRSRALNADDVAIPDVHKLVRVMRAAVRQRRALPRRRKRIWVTEVSWDSRPPDPDGVPAATHARWLEDSFFQLWRQGVDTITWFQVRDQLPNPSFGETYQSGVLFADGRPKPAARAFRFPFVMTRRGRGGAVAWGRAPAGGGIVIEQRRGRGWRVRKSFRARRHGTFLVRLRAPRGATFRARIGPDTSLPWRLR
ncbi:MAG: hypothetical protein M3545_15060 [Acidobacteriota bacterium]|nr:hypothetical protein [Acidobacteriota bacterium]